MNRQRKVRIKLGWLRRFAGLALSECREESADDRFALKRFRRWRWRLFRTGSLAGCMRNS